MLKGKKLYERAREFADTELIPALNADDISEEEKNSLAEEAATLGIGLVIDIAESLHKIATKIG